jgi:hypothetical protein
VGEHYVILRRHNTGGAARVGGQKGQSMRVTCSADINPEAAMEAPRRWESKDGGLVGVSDHCCSCSCSLTQDFLELFMQPHTAGYLS